MNPRMQNSIINSFTFKEVPMHYYKELIKFIKD